MCATYRVMDEEMNNEMRKIFSEIDRQHNGTETYRAMKFGDIRPTDVSAIIAYDGPKPIRWGYPAVYGSKRPVINARQETAMSSPYFRGGVANGRIVVPTNGFYEWMHDASKKATDKYLFLPDGEQIMYLAGVYAPFRMPDGKMEERFTIFTTAANDSMIKYHDRMPVYVAKNEIDMWLGDAKCVEEILRRQQPRLKAMLVEPPKPKSVQMSFFN